ncbi:hypothetical protein SCATT_44520 [Streptantibioticus cattleyicolor NRRL 8057 = DSM 46488]|uniref:Uncharacterized protein n=1 Tax=Streptantibioticus cattleyicolor (strain ATCC 35852 / DSM 46488 / JCM 4925 / NBRC 14057 / NRRL 8057) TaxID=1003195 RepID=G8WXJ3_STREN|nr:hypothetical protein SCATT_44520 [Streptantibioticus cattleyicolor NRRL 8057 = DSM 46488]
MDRRVPPDLHRPLTVRPRGSATRWRSAGSLALVVSHYSVARFARFGVPGWPPFAPARWGVGVGFWSGSARGGFAYASYGVGGAPGVTPRSRYPPQLGSGYWVAAGTPPTHPLAPSCGCLSSRVGVSKEVGVTPISFSPPPCRSAERNRTGACRGVPAATQRGGGEPTTKRGARSHPGGPPETKADSAHPALYEHSHGWAGEASVTPATTRRGAGGAPRR